MSECSGSLLTDAWKLSFPGSGDDGASTVLAMAGKGAVQIVANLHNGLTFYRFEEVLYPGLSDIHVWFCPKEVYPSFIAVSVRSFIIGKSKCGSVHAA